MASDAHGSMRELLRYNITIHITGLHAALLHFHDSPLLGKVSPIEAPKLFR